MRARKTPNTDTFHAVNKLTVLYEWIVGYNIWQITWSWLFFSIFKLKKLIIILQLLLTVVSTSVYYLHMCCFFSIRVFFTDTDNSQDSRGSKGTIFYSTLPLPPTHEQSDIYLQLGMWDDYHIFSHTITFCIYQTTIRWDLRFWWYRIIIRLIDNVMLLFVCLLDDLILAFCYSNLTRETGELELALTITLVLGANLLTKCALISSRD